jgi:hypothetical protein
MKRLRDTPLLSFDIAVAISRPIPTAPRNTLPRVTIQKRNVINSCAKMDKSAPLGLNRKKEDNAHKLDAVWI